MLRPMSPPNYRASHRAFRRAPASGSSPSTPPTSSRTHAASPSSRCTPKTTWATAARRTRSSPRSASAFRSRSMASALSIGGAKPLDREHLCRLQRLVALYRPGLFSEHLAWSTHDGVYLNDLLPLPYNETTLARVAAHVDQVQKVLGVKMLLENPSTYRRLRGIHDERDGVSLRGRRAHRLRPAARREQRARRRRRTTASTRSTIWTKFPVAAVGEIHLGGHAEERDRTAPRF